MLDLLSSDRNRSWRTSEVARHLDEHPSMEIVLAITRLHRAGLIERLGPATYRAATGRPADVRKVNDDRLWGHR